jgi:hypothetical protein
MATGNSPSGNAFPSPSPWGRKFPIPAPVNAYGDRFCPIPVPARGFCPRRSPNLHEDVSHSRKDGNGEFPVGECLPISVLVGEKISHPCPRQRLRGQVLSHPHPRTGILSPTESPSPRRRQSQIKMATGPRSPIPRREFFY